MVSTVLSVIPYWWSIEVIFSSFDFNHKEIQAKSLFRLKEGISNRNQNNQNSYVALKTNKFNPPKKYFSISKTHSHFNINQIFSADTKTET